jgi:hypothetical protein
MERSEILDVPLSIVVPAKLSNKASAESCGLFFPHTTKLSLGLSVDWAGKTHLIHLDGSHLYREAGIEIGRSLRGAMIREIEYRVDLASRYNSADEWDPAGALVIKDGELSLYCRELGNRVDNDPYPVPIGTGLPVASEEEACGFTRWSIAIREDGKAKVLWSFEAIPREER